MFCTCVKEMDLCPLLPFAFSYAPELHAYLTTLPRCCSCWGPRKGLGKRCGKGGWKALLLNPIFWHQENTKWKLDEIAIKPRVGRWRRRVRWANKHFICCNGQYFPGASQRVSGCSWNMAHLWNPFICLKGDLSGTAEGSPKRVVRL